jgi:DNA-binding CsgD family transcriptional regulator
LFVENGVSGKGVHMASVQRIKAAERSADALRLKSEGHSYRQIADKLGYKSPDGAYKAVKRGLDKLLVEPAEAYVKMQLSEMLKTIRTKRC